VSADRANGVLEKERAIVRRTVLGAAEGILWFVWFLFCFVICLERRESIIDMSSVDV
jgi:hypothetical protein